MSQHTKSDIKLRLRLCLFFFLVLVAQIIVTEIHFYASYVIYTTLLLSYTLLYQFSPD